MKSLIKKSLQDIQVLKDKTDLKFWGEDPILYKKTQKVQEKYFTKAAKIIEKQSKLRAALLDIEELVA